MSKYILEVARVSMFNGIASCLEEYETSENSKRTGVNSVSIFKVDDGRPYVVQLWKYKSGTTKIFAYEDNK